jgi:acyl-CoA thioester hydrolase
MSHRFSIRVYYEDTDFAGVVYHANYLKFLERGRTEWLRDKGVDQLVLSENHGVHFAVRHMEIDFIKPARMDDVVSVQTYIEQQTGARLVLKQSLIRDEEILLTASVTIVLVGEDGRPRRLNHIALNHAF